MTQGFSNAVWPRYSEFIKSARTIDTEALRTHPTTARLRQDAGTLEIAVRDHGCGIAEKDIETILKPFGQVAGAYARAEGGTGLGLPITKSFAELHGGTLNIASILDEGTIVTIVFPPDRLFHANAVPARSGEIAA